MGGNVGEISKYTFDNHQELFPVTHQSFMRHNNHRLLKLKLDSFNALTKPCNLE